MPGLFGLHAITFWQAIGLMSSGPALVWRFPAGSAADCLAAARCERWEQMTPEEREKFREGMRGRCGQARTAAPTASV